MTEATGSPETIPISKVSCGKGYLRRTRGDITGLKETISDVGLLQPIIVRRSGDGFTLIDGSRRLQALKELNIVELIIDRDVIIDNDETDADAMFKQVIANIQREDINDIELGHAFVLLNDKYNYSYKEIAEIICKTPHYVVSKAGMAKRLTPELQEMIVRDWEEQKVIRNTFSDENPQAPYEMNVNIIEDIARLPPELQKDAYLAIKASEMEKKDALSYLRMLKAGVKEMKLSGELNELMNYAGQAEHDVADIDLRKYLKKIDRDLNRLVISVKESGYTNKDKIVPVIESLIEKLYTLRSEINSVDQATGETALGN